MDTHGPHTHPSDEWVESLLREHKEILVKALRVIYQSSFDSNAKSTAKQALVDTYHDPDYKPLQGAK